MLSKGIFQITYVLTKFSFHVTSIIPFTFTNQQKLAIVSRNTKVRKIWSIIIIFNFVSSILQILDWFLWKRDKNLIIILFHGFTFMANCSLLCITITYYCQAKGFCCFLNCIISRPNGLFNIFNNQNVNTNKKLTCLVSTVTLIVATAYIIVLPAITFVFPCLYGSSFLIYLLGRCNTLGFRILAVFQLIGMAVGMGTLGPLLVTHCFLTINEITENLHHLKFILQGILASQNNKSKIVRIEKIGMFYRQIQIFAILCNECLSLLIFPTLEFVGSLTAISFLYALLAFNNLLSGLLKTVVLIALVTNCFICGYTLNIGSKCVVLSKEVISKVKRSGLGSKYSKKLIQSCSPIELRIGSFHKLYRDRVPTLMRYILQRTIFLVLKTKQSGTAGHLTISVTFSS